MSREFEIVLACSGLGNVSRGYEASVLDVFKAIQNGENGVRLFRGGSKEKEGNLCPAVSRNSRLYKLPILRRVSDYRRYWLENITFLLALVLRISIKPADVVFTPDHVVADYLERLRKLIPGKPNIIFSNGAPFENEFCKRFKYIHQKSKEHYHPETTPNSRMFLIGNSFDTDRFRRPSDFNASAFKTTHNLPTDKTIILSLSALNISHKRVDWIIDETVKLGDGYHLVMCGQEDSETRTLKDHAEKSKINCTFMTVPSSEVPSLIWASDIMVLGSLSEGFPRVVGEAMASEVPILVHPHENGRWILGEQSPCLVDMTIEGELAKKIEFWTLGGEPDAETIQANARKLQNEFSRERVMPKYLEMFEYVGNKNENRISN